MKKSLILICILAGGLAACAQKRLDSLHHLLSRSPDDTTRLRVLTTIAEAYRTSRMDSAIFYASQVLSYPARPQFHFFKAHASNSIGYARYMKGEYSLAIEAFRQYYQYASLIDDTKNMAFAINNEGNVYIELGDYAEALAKYRQSLQLWQRLDDASGIAMSYNNMGFIYKDVGDYEKAVTNFLFALRQFEKLNDEAAIAVTCNYLGAVSIRQKDFDQALLYQKRAYDIYTKLNDRGAIGICLQYFANIHAEKGDHEKALEYYLDAQDLYAETKDLRQLGLVKANIAELYSRRGMHEKALPFYRDAISIYQDISNQRSLASIYLSAAVSLIETKDLPGARTLMDSAALLTEKTKNKEHLRSIYEVESKYHAALGNYSRALQFAHLYDSLKDTLLNEANIKSLRDMQVKYETQKKEQEITLLNKDNAIKALEITNQRLQIKKNLFDLTQNQLALSEADLEIANNQVRINAQNETILKHRLDSTEKEKNIQSLQKQTRIQNLEILARQLQVDRRNMIIAALGAVLLLALLLGYSYYRRYKMKQEARMREAVLKQQELATRAVLEAEEAERQRIAKDLHDGVGQMMSAAKMNLSAYQHQVFFKTDDEQLAFEKIIALVDESCTEVRAVSHNMMPNALLKNSLASAVREFVDKLDHKALKVHLYTEGLEERLDSNVETVLYRVIQECVNNVIKHSDANALDISLVRESGEITATVEDNGKGFDIKDQQKTEGIGLKNIRTRVEYLKGSVDFDTMPGKGTLVAIHVPLPSTNP